MSSFEKLLSQGTLSQTYSVEDNHCMSEILYCWAYLMLCISQLPL